MNPEQMKKLINKRMNGHLQKVKMSEVSRNYFKLENDILMNKEPTNVGVVKPENHGLRHADNRIPHNFHQLLLEQTISYGFTVPPQFDVDDDKGNDLVRGEFDSEGYFAQVCGELCLEVMHFGCSYIHYWLDKNGDFQYAVIPGEQVIPLYGQGLKRELSGLLRYYVDEDENGDDIIVYEYWNDYQVVSFKNKGNVLLAQELHYHEMFGSGNGKSHTLKHPFPGHIPFVPFANGYNEQPNLFRYKKLVDAYDSVFSGFIDDVEDLQEIVLVLTNYGGTDLGQFKQELKEFKAIKIDQMDDQDKSGVQALEIQIPVEARQKILDLLKVAIWDAGQGFRPTTETITATSGVALDQMYSSLELKVKLMENRFRPGFSELIKVYLDHKGHKDYNEIKVKQDWRRNRVKSMIEMANTIAVLSNVTSRENLAKNNPLVPDWQAELSMKEKDDQERMDQQLEMQNQFSNIGFSQGLSNSQSSGTLEPNNPSNNNKKIRKQQIGKGVGNE